MKFPHHLVLDYTTKRADRSLKYWTSYRVNQKKLKLNKNNLTVSNLSNRLSAQNFLKFKFFIKNNIYATKILKFNEAPALLTKKIKRFASLSNKPQLSFFNFLFDFNFLKKEKMYTKLKYSRVPQYDAVSGASAALLAGFLGFLICEKFGFELLDSGDFYFLFMYLVFLIFFCRLFVKLFTKDLNTWNVLSLKWINYYFLISFKLLKSLVLLK